MGNKITICHWNESGHWNAIEVSTNALDGHLNHFDIWPPVEGVTPGENWPKGETVYLNGCVLEVTGGPSPSPSPTSSLPETGSAELMGFTALSFVLIVVGLLLIARSDKNRLDNSVEDRRPEGTDSGNQ